MTEERHRNRERQTAEENDKIGFSSVVRAAAGSEDHNVLTKPFDLLNSEFASAYDPQTISQDTKRYVTQSVEKDEADEEHVPAGRAGI